MSGKRLIWLTVNCSYSHSSLALPAIHARCKNIPGWEWLGVETTIDDDPMEVAARLIQSGPNLIAAPLYLFNHAVVADILSRVKELAPDCHIAVGGPECLGKNAETILERHSFIGTVFRGEGEAVFPDFLRDFDHRHLRAVIPSSGNAVDENWIDSPPPVEDKFFRTDKPFVQLETSRGCPMGCTYCTSCRSKLRFKSIAAIRHELEELDRRGVTEIRVLDRTFNYPTERGCELLRLFLDEFPQIHFHLEIHPQFLDDSLRSILSRAPHGQLHIEAGIQSLNRQVQQAIGRNSDPDQALAGVHFLASCPNFETHVDLLAGLPGQTLASIFDDVSTLIETNSAEIQLEVLKVLPGTLLRETAQELGLCFCREVPYDVMQTRDMSCDDLLNSRRLSRLLDLTSNHPALHPVIQAAHRDNPAMLGGLLDFFIAHGLDLKRLFDLKKRFLLLWAFFNGKDYQITRQVLAAQWLKSGYPALEGPGVQAARVNVIPDDAILQQGNPDARSEKETKILYLAVEENDFYFAFNRKFAMNHPAAIWRIAHKQTGKNSL